MENRVHGGRLETDPTSCLLLVERGEQGQGQGPVKTLPGVEHLSERRLGALASWPLSWVGFSPILTFPFSYLTFNMEPQIWSQPAGKKHRTHKNPPYYKRTYLYRERFTKKKKMKF
jgi:hypothetical protein